MQREKEPGTVEPLPGSLSSKPKGSSCAVQKNLIVWEDLFVVIDDGMTPLEEYDRLEEILAEHVRERGTRFGIVVLVPPQARPPTEAHRTYLRMLFDRIRGLACALVWVIEGSGFAGAAMLGVLTGFQVAMRGPGYYPLHITHTLEDAVESIFPLLTNGAQRLEDRAAAIRAIRAARAEIQSLD
ncbi:MAG: hypothetical protein HOW73_29875 [Polyangiaceae bacterium]|nr:hypothetical protein [Polyangiaceae bacterium]